MRAFPASSHAAGLFRFARLLTACVSPIAAFADGIGGFDLTARLSQVSVFQSGGNAFSGMLTLNPGYDFSSMLGLGLQLGGSAFLDQNKEIFPVGEGLLTARVHFGDGLMLEPGAGLQYWADNGDVLRTAGMGVVFPFKSRVMWASEAFAGFHAVLVPKRLTTVARVGIGF